MSTSRDAMMPRSALGCGSMFLVKNAAVAILPRLKVNKAVARSRRRSSSASLSAIERRLMTFVPTVHGWPRES